MSILSRVEDDERPFRGQVTPIVHADDGSGLPLIPSGSIVPPHF